MARFLMFQDRFYNKMVVIKHIYGLIQPEQGNMTCPPGPTGPCSADSFQSPGGLVIFPCISPYLYSIARAPGCLSSKCLLSRNLFLLSNTFFFQYLQLILQLLKSFSKISL